MTAAFAAPSYHDFSPTLRPSFQGRTKRAQQALTRSRLARLHVHGYAPDQEHGAREIGAIYDLDDPSLLEDTVFVTALRSDCGRTLVTVGRWQQGFFDILQVVVPDAAKCEGIQKLTTLLRGAKRALSIGRHDLRSLTSTLDDECTEPLHRCALLPIARDRAELLDQEQAVLGLSREDLVAPREVDSVFRQAIGGDPLATRRLLDAGRIDLLTGLALYIERLVRLPA